MESDPIYAADARFLRKMSKRISREELRNLSAEAGFQPPVSFEIARIIKVLQDARFPASDHLDYLWALYECEFLRLTKYSPAMKIFISALYVYCNKRCRWAVEIESDFYALGVIAALEEEAMAQEFLMFLEWLEDAVAPAKGHSNYFGLLSWACLKLRIGDSSSPIFANAIELLQKKAKGHLESEFTNSVDGLQRWRNIEPRLLGGGEGRQLIISVLPTQNGA